LENKLKETEDLDDLLLIYKSCTDEKKRKMLHIDIVEKSMSLVKKIACNIAVQSGISNEDLIQVGSIGLIKAVEFFDSKKNTKFKTYASYFIRGEIKHYLRDKASIIKAPRELQELVFKISSAVKELKEKGFDEPTEEQIADIVDVSVNKIHEVMEIELCKTTLSLDQAVSSVEDDDLALIDKIPSGDYQEFLNSYENKIMLATAIDKLPSDLKQIIELSYYQDLNQREISEKVHISQMQVSRRLKKALSKMYEIIKEDI
jgi:RNA polymerase sigma-B factor